MEHKMQIFHQTPTTRINWFVWQQAVDTTPTKYRLINSTSLHVRFLFTLPADAQTTVTSHTAPRFATWRMEVGDSHVFAFLSPPRQTSGSLAAQVHQLVALTASAGCFGSTRLDLSGDFLGGAVGYDADEGESGQ